MAAVRRRNCHLCSFICCTPARPPLVVMSAAMHADASAPSSSIVAATFAKLHPKVGRTPQRNLTLPDATILDECMHG
jgi:hypothetical protein